MRIGPLGPQGVQARIREIQSRMQELFENENEPVRTESSNTRSFVQMVTWNNRAQRELIRPLSVQWSNMNVDLQSLKQIAQSAAQEFNLDEDIFIALISAESAWNPNAVSPKGAKGLAQLMPDTARALGVADPFDPAQNLRGGAKFLRQMLDQFGSYELALAAYNAGPGAVRRYNGIPPYSETQNYVRKILGEVNR